MDDIVEKLRSLTSLAAREALSDAELVMALDAAASDARHEIMRLRNIEKLVANLIAADQWAIDRAQDNDRSGSERGEEMRRIMLDLIKMEMSTFKTSPKAWESTLQYLETGEPSPEHVEASS